MAAPLQIISKRPLYLALYYTGLHSWKNHQFTAPELNFIVDYVAMTDQLMLIITISFLLCLWT
jgi:hypothetical protein